MTIYIFLSSVFMVQNVIGNSYYALFIENKRDTNILTNLYFKEPFSYLLIS